MAAVAVLLAGLGGVPAVAAPHFQPEIFFSGRTRASGALADSFGNLTSRFTGVTQGRRDPDGATTFDQVVRLDDGSVRRRSFRLVRTGPDTVDLTGSEVVGTAHGSISGDTLRVASTIRLEPGNPLSDVVFDQTFRRLPGGRSVSNHSDISVLGIVVRRADEVFTRTEGAR